MIRNYQKFKSYNNMIINKLSYCSKIIFIALVFLSSSSICKEANANIFKSIIKMFDNINILRVGHHSYKAYDRYQNNCEKNSYKYSSCKNKYLLKNRISQKRFNIKIPSNNKLGLE